MPSSTGQQIREELHRYGLIRLLGQGTATAGGTDRIRDTLRLDATPLAATKFDGCIVRLTAAGGSADGEQSHVDYLDMDAGDIYVDPVFTGSPTNAVTYEIWRAGLNPDDVDRLRDEALTTLCSQWQLIPISLVTNASYFNQTSDAPDSWTTSNTAVTQEDAEFPDHQWPYNMLVTNSGADGYAASASIYAIRDGDYFYLYVPVSARVGTAEVKVRDVTNSADISLSGTSTETRRGWSAIEVTGQVPSGCDEIQVWLGAQGASDVAEYGPVFFHQQQGRRIGMDARVDTMDNVGPVYTMTRYPIANGQGHFGMEDRQEVTNVRKIRNQDLGFFQFDGEWMQDRPYFYEERIFYSALSTGGYLTAANRTTGDAATTLCPRDYAAAGTAKLVAEFQALKHPHELEFWTTVLAVAQERLDKYERKYGPEAKASLTRERDLPRFWLPV